VALADELALVERARRQVEDALVGVEPPLRRARLQMMVAQALVGRAGFDAPGLGLPDPMVQTRLREAFAEADRANWALIDLLASLAGPPDR